MVETLKQLMRKSNTLFTKNSLQSLLKNHPEYDDYLKLS